MKFILYFLLFVSIILNSSMLNAEEFSPWDAWRQGYINSEKARKARLKGSYTESLRAYKLAKGEYLKVQQSRPDWNQKIISEKIKDCDLNIEKLEELIGNIKASEEIAPLINSSIREGNNSSSNLASELENARKELAIARQRLLNSMTEVERLRREIKQMKTDNGEIINLLREQRELKEQNNLLQQRYNALKSEKAKPNEQNRALHQQLLDEKFKYDLLVKRFELLEQKNKEFSNEIIKYKLGEKNVNSELKNSKDNILRKEKELEQLRSIQASNQSEYQSLKSYIKRLENTLKNSNKHLNDKNNELKQLQNRLELVIKEGGSSSKLNATLQQENQTLHNKIIKFQETFKEKDESITKLQEKQRDLRLELVRLKDTLSRVDTLRKNSEITLLAQEKQIKQDKDAITKVKEALKLSEENYKRSENTLQSWSNRYKDLEERYNNQFNMTSGIIKKSESDKQNLIKQIEDLKIKIAGNNAEFKRMNDEKLEWLKQEELLKTNISQCENTIKILNSRIEEISNQNKIANNTNLEFQKLEINFKALQKENQNMRKVISENENIKSKLENLSKLQTEINSVKSLLAKEQMNNEQLKKQITTLSLENKQNETQTIKPQKSTIQLPPNPSTVADNINVELLLKDALKAEKEQKIELAIWNYKTILSVDANNEKANLNLGRLLAKRLEYSQASNYLQKAFNINPNDNLLLDYCNNLIELKKYGNVIELLRNKNDKNVELIIVYAKALSGIGKNLEAEKLLNKVIALEPQNSNAYKELSKVALSSNEQTNLEKAAKYYEKSRELGGEIDSQLEKSLGSILNKQREMNDFMLQAINEAEKAKDWTTALWYYKQINNQKHFENMIFAQIMANEEKEAINLLSTNTSNIERELLLSLANVRLGNSKKAEEHAQKAFALNKNRPIILPKNKEKIKTQLLKKIPDTSTDATNMYLILDKIFK